MTKAKKSKLPKGKRRVYIGYSSAYGGSSLRVQFDTSGMVGDIFSYTLEVPTDGCKKIITKTCHAK